MNLWTESREDDASITFVFEFPGACGWGISVHSAIYRLKQDMAWERDWLERHEEPLPADRGLQYHEVVPATGDPLKADTEAFFSWDLDPLTEADRETRLRWLANAHADLTAAARRFDSLDRPLAEGKRTVAEVLSHVAVAEWWYLTRLPGGPELPHWNTWPEEPFARLDRALALSLETMRGYADAGKVVTLDGETWSARKVSRRLTWHAMWHLKELHRYLK